MPLPMSTIVESNQNILYPESYKDPHLILPYSYLQGFENRAGGDSGKETVKSDCDMGSFIGNNRRFVAIDDHRAFLFLNSAVNLNLELNWAFGDGRHGWNRSGSGLCEECQTNQLCNDSIGVASRVGLSGHVVSLGFGIRRGC